MGKKTSAYFLYHNIFYLSDHYLPACSDIARLLPDTSIPSLQHMSSGNLSVPGCKICPLYSVSVLSSSHTAALAQGQGCVCKVSHISTDSRHGRKSRQIPVHNLISWGLGKEGKCIELNGFRGFFHVKHSKRNKNIFSKTKI